MYIVYQNCLVYFILLCVHIDSNFNGEFSSEHCVPRAQVREVSSRLYLFVYCLNPYETMNFTRFRHQRNAT